MNRRELLLKGGTSAASLLLGAEMLINNRVQAETLLPENRFEGFGKYGSELIVPNSDDISVAETWQPGNWSTISSIDGSSKSSRTLTRREIGDQFFVFQLTPTKDGKWFVKPPQNVEPSLETNEQFPDVVLDSRLVSFHLGEAEKLDEDTRATVRITFGSDQNTFRARDMGDNLYWAVTSGVNLWNSRNTKAQPKDFRSDFRRVFGNKYVELPGGAGTLKVEIVKHKKSSWWDNIFDFSQSGTGKTLISALGFPGVTSNALKFVDDAANRFVGSNADVIFSSRGLPIAFTKQSRKEIMATGTRIGSLKTGIWIFARGKDLPLLASQEMTYDATFRRLFPAKRNMTEIISGRAPDPLKDVTYAIMNTRLKRRKINIGF